MQITSVTQPGSVTGSAEAPAVRRQAPVEREPAAAAAAGRADALARAFDAVPEVRPEAVIQGRELYEQVPYPPTEIIRGLSQLIARFYPGS